MEFIVYVKKKSQFYSLVDKTFICTSMNYSLYVHVHIEKNLYKFMRIFAGEFFLKIESKARFYSELLQLETPLWCSDMS